MSASILSLDCGEMTGGMSVVASCPGPTWGVSPTPPPPPPPQPFPPKPKVPLPTAPPTKQTHPASSTSRGSASTKSQNSPYLSHKYPEHLLFKIHHAPDDQPFHVLILDSSWKPIPAKDLSMFIEREMEKSEAIWREDSSLGLEQEGLSMVGS